MTTFTINTPLRNYFFYKLGPNVGQPLTDGTLVFLDETTREPLTVYSDVSNNDNPVAYTNPLPLDEDGGCPPIYLQDAAYFISCYSSEGDLQFTDANYRGATFNGDPAPPPVVQEAVNNFLLDGQFNLGLNDLEIPIDGTSATISKAGWAIAYAGSVSPAVFFNKFALGDDTVPFTPYASLQVTKAIGTGETLNYVYFPLKNVRSLETQEICINFWAKSALSTPTTFGVLQDFGTGGSPSAAVFTYAGIASLTNTYAQYSAVITVPSCAGKTLGSNGNDFFAVYFALPLNSAVDFYLTNACAVLGAVVPSYPYFSYAENLAEALANVLAVNDTEIDGASNIGFSDSSIPDVPVTPTTVRNKLLALSNALTPSSLINNFANSSSVSIFNINEKITPFLTTHGANTGATSTGAVFDSSPTSGALILQKAIAVISVDAGDYSYVDAFIPNCLSTNGSLYGVRLVYTSPLAVSTILNSSASSQNDLVNFSIRGFSELELGENTFAVYAGYLPGESAATIQIASAQDASAPPSVTLNITPTSLT